MILNADKVRAMMPSRESMATTFVNDCMPLIIDRAKKGLSNATICLGGNEEMIFDDIAKSFKSHGYTVTRGTDANYIVIDWSVV